MNNSTSTAISRRTLTRGAAWSVPVILASSAIPAYAASTCPTVNYTTTPSTTDENLVTTVIDASGSGLTGAFNISAYGVARTPNNMFTNVSNMIPAQFDSALWQDNGDNTLTWIGSDTDTANATVTWAYPDRSSYEPYFYDPELYDHQTVDDIIFEPTNAESPNFISWVVQGTECAGGVEREVKIRE